jgi:hypothetical protein
MGYRIKVGDQYVKRTCKFRAFGGKVLCTTDIREARVWSRVKDAKNAAWCVALHRDAYNRKHIPTGLIALDHEDLPFDGDTDL